MENVDRNDIRYYAEPSNHFPPPSARFLFSFVQVLFFGPFECSPNAKGKPFYEFSYGTKLFYFIFGIPRSSPYHLFRGFFRGDFVCCEMLATKLLYNILGWNEMRAHRQSSLVIFNKNYFSVFNSVSFERMKREEIKRNTRDKQFTIKIVVENLIITFTHIR